jgi:Rrf2 family protein
MFSKACEYGIRATIFIAQRSMKGRRSNLKEISEAITSPLAFTAKILQLLVKHNIIFSTKGATGGFEMAYHSFNTLNLKQLVHAIDGDGSTTSCIVGLNTCSRENPCPIHHKYVTIRTNLAIMLEEMTIAQLIEMEHFTLSNNPI